MAFMFLQAASASAPVGGAGSASSGSSNVPLVMGGVPPEHQLLPDLDIFNLSSASGGAGAGAANATKKKDETEEELEDNLPLFYQ